MEFTPGETNVICTEIDRSLVFYRDALGYRLVEMDDGAARLALGDRYLLLLPLASEPVGEAPYGERAEISFDLRTDDLEGAATHLAACGVAFETPWERGGTYFVIRDPDGLRIEVVGGSVLPG
ncbi:MAG: catechol 2,3-dioxygenase-like lactoylglutathione lyase family enzyme [Myxococcota bacterium]|jgi:catechol 2,3-dioxygenase-like lactoylglutathione lyase family enzyme